MGLKGQMLELRNEGHFQYLLKVGVYDDLLPSHPSSLMPDGVEDESLPLDKSLQVFECRLDFSDPDNPLSYPLGELEACMDIYDTHETPENLSREQERLWKIGFIVDVVIAETFSTDLLEVIHGEDYERVEELGSGAWQEGHETRTGSLPETVPPKVMLQIRCPDCGAAAYAIARQNETGEAANYACGVCGRRFAI